MRRTKPAGAWVGRESDFQKQAIKLVRMIAATAGVPPEAVMHVPNGGQRSARAGAYLKAEGAVPGYPDIMVFAPRLFREDMNPGAQLYNGLSIELKVFSNKPDANQLNIHNVLRDAGWIVSVCYGLGEVEAIAKAYFQK